MKNTQVVCRYCSTALDNNNLCTECHVDNQDTIPLVIWNDKLKNDQTYLAIIDKAYGKEYVAGKIPIDLDISQVEKINAFLTDNGYMSKNSRLTIVAKNERF